MERLMIVVLMYVNDERHVEKSFVSRVECVAAAEACVARCPELEWHEPSDDVSIIRPVVRSAPQCIPAGDE